MRLNVHFHVLYLDGVYLRPIADTLGSGLTSLGAPLRANTGRRLYSVSSLFCQFKCPCRLRGKATLIRYADDFVVVFEKEADAREFADVLPKRFAKYGLRLHPEKTRLVNFTRPKTPPADGGSEAGSFDLLGFTHFWGRSLKGRWVVKRKTAKDRFKRALHRVSMWCREHRHNPIKEQHARLCMVLRGHNAYFGITGNGRALASFRDQVTQLWYKWLARRSWRTSTLSIKRSEPVTRRTGCGRHCSIPWPRRLS